MPRSHPDIPLVPADCVAARVIAPCDQYGKFPIEPPNNKLNPIMDVPPHVRKTPPTFTTNHTGKKLGRLTVVGYYGANERRNDARKHIWLVRCVCGMYEFRNGKSLLQGKEVSPMCQICRKVEELKKR
jgi:hypothetical protein